LLAVKRADIVAPFVRQAPIRDETMVQPFRSASLAFALSLMAHGLLALALAFLPGPVSRASFDTVIVEPVRGVSLSLANPHSSARGTDGPGNDAEEQHAPPEEFVASVVEQTTKAPGNGAGAAPVVVSRPADAHAGTVGPRGSTSARAGTGQTYSALEVPPTARSVVYLLDRSLSMGPGGALSRARRELLASLSHLPAETVFQVLVYNRQAEPLRVDGKTGYLTPDQTTREAVARELDRIAAAGKTDHLLALRKALSLRPDVLFLVTDADDMSAAEVGEVTRLNAGQTAIHAVEMSRGHSDELNPLRELAARNHGTYRRVSPTE
jgi:hypothetical protein